MKVVFIADLLSKEVEHETKSDTKEMIKGLIYKLKSFSTTPLNAKQALRMLPFSENNLAYNVVLEIIGNYKIWELYSYEGDPNGLRMYDTKAYWYMIALLLCKLSNEAETTITEIIDKIDHKYDYRIMLRTLGFFNDDRISKLKTRLEARFAEVTLE